MSEYLKNRWYVPGEWQHRWPIGVQPKNILQAAAWAIYDVTGSLGPMTSKYPIAHSTHRFVEPETPDSDPEETFWQYAEKQFKK